MSLYLFDIDGTLVRSFMREGGGGASQAYDLIEVLPGRRERLDALRSEGYDMALVTNQGGVAFGYQTPKQVCRKMGAVLRELGWPTFGIAAGPERDGGAYSIPITCYMALHHPKATLPDWRCEADDDWRKPGAGMLHQAMRDYDAKPDETVYVGDMESDRQAADAAGCAFHWAADFFA